MNIAACILTLICGCGGLTPAARQKLVSGDALYKRGDYRAAQNDLDFVVRESPNAPEAAEAYYIRGLCHQQMTHRAAAESDFQRCLALSKRPDLTAKAQACLGHLYLEAGNFQQAANLFAAALPALGKETNTDEVLLRNGICLQRLGKWEDARFQFSQLMHRFPDSKHNDEARRRFSWPSGGYSIQCGAFQAPGPADAMVQALRGAKLDARRSAEGRAGRPLHMVYVGRYPTYAEAQSALAGVRKVVTDALIVP